MQYLIRNKHWDIVEDYNLDKLLYILIDRPNINIGHMVWCGDKFQWHRNYDLPAFITSGGILNWYIDGLTKRSIITKPIALYTNGHMEYK